MTAICLLLYSIMSSFSANLFIEWGTTDTSLTFMQSFYVWVRYVNKSPESIRLDKERSKIDFYIKAASGEYNISTASITFGDEVYLRPSNSLISHYGASIGRMFGLINAPEMAVLVARSRNGDIIRDSTRKVHLEPPTNPKSIEWFYAFDSLRGDDWMKISRNSKSIICRIADSMLKESFDKIGIPSVIKTAADMEFHAYCRNEPYVCNGFPNITTPYAVAFSNCMKKGCSEFGAKFDVPNYYCPELFDLRNQLTMTILKHPKKIESDIHEYIRFANPADTTYFSVYQFRKEKVSKK